MMIPALLYQSHCPTDMHIINEMRQNQLDPRIKVILLFDSVYK
jgi:hypothetical protein